MHISVSSPLIHFSDLLRPFLHVSSVLTTVKAKHVAQNVITALQKVNTSMYMLVPLCLSCVVTRRQCGYFISLWTYLNRKLKTNEYRRQWEDQKALEVAAVSTSPCGKRSDQANSKSSANINNNKQRPGLMKRRSCLGNEMMQAAVMQYKPVP
jgi:hypothetical protein